MPSTKIPKSFQQDGQDLISKINSLIAKAVKSKFDGNPSRHPLLFVNAVKNIIGDDRENPSIKLLNLLFQFFYALTILFVTASL